MPRKTRVAVVFGGRSSEHAISCVTAGSVLAALDRERYDVIPVGITREGRWVLAPDDPARLAITAGVLPAVEDSGAEVLLPTDPGRRDLVVLEPGSMPTALGDVDVVFPLLHGPYGEDGTIQGLLELAGIPYVGSGVLASAASMDKDVMKRLLSSAGMEVGEYVVLGPGEWDRDVAAATAKVSGLGWPVFVKPARGGSSIGISKVPGPEGLEKAVREAEPWDPKVVVEAAVAGREIECGVLGGLDGAAAEASLPAEIRVVGGHDFYDFDAKYLDDATEMDVPAGLDAETTARVQRLAVQAFEALGCEGLARVDFFLCPDGRLVVNELNTMPGFTPASMFPRMWAATGLDYPALVDRLLQLALGRSTGLR
ncbi:MAG: D-alanine-D-alanine ligase [Frankiaceae bacterium]|jgi:D-alanine-D-alanine ligase|nr:D-alanine-D-alanine ligase [Frankiaceae bacterium]